MIKLCKDCRRFDAPSERCIHEKALKTYSPRLVYGGPPQAAWYYSAEVMRGSDCGPKGKYWESAYIDAVVEPVVLALPAPNAVSSFSKIVQFFRFGVSK